MLLHLETVSCPKKTTTPTYKQYWGPVVQWLALWTLNPEIRVQVSAGPCIAVRLRYIKVEPWNYSGTLGFDSMSSFPPDLRCLVRLYDEANYA